MLVLVMAKTPVAGLVKTRLCPPLSAMQAAAYAEAAIADTLAAVEACSVDERVIALDGEPGDWIPDAFRVIPQEGRTFSERLANAWAATGSGGIQIGMDTPQITAAMLESALALVAPGRALLGPARDGGWWALGLSAPDPEAFDGVPMSRADTGVRQRQRLGELGYDVVDLESLIDVDTFDDAVEVAEAAPDLVSSRRLETFAVERHATLLDDD